MAEHFKMSEELREWREEVREFLRENVTDALLQERDEIGGYDHGLEPPGPERRKFLARLGERRWCGISIPTEYEGLGKGYEYLLVLLREIEYWGAPWLGFEVTAIAPILVSHGTEQNRQEFLPRIARGELTTALGYSEPEAGTDLANVKTRAVLDGDEWVINGHKIWTSTTHASNHIWLCVRTDPDAPKHKGISVIMVPKDTPGITFSRIVTWADERTNEVFLDDVRVPKGNLIGEVNQAWSFIAGALGMERLAINRPGEYRRMLDDLLRVAHQQVEGGRRPIDDPVVRRKLVQLEAEVELTWLMDMEGIHRFKAGEIPTALVTISKIYGSELRQRIADVGTQILGMFALVTADDPHAILLEEIANGDRPGRYASTWEREYRIGPLQRFGGGTNDVMRDVLARSLGLPRTSR